MDQIFSRNFDARTERSDIVQREWTMEPFRDVDAVRVFSGFQERFQSEHFDLISIDAPLGGDMKEYARIDVLKLLPDCLGENFVIMIDDSQRSGEINTIKEMENRLNACQIKYCIGRYKGDNECTLICAASESFLITM